MDKVYTISNSFPQDTIPEWTLERRKEPRQWEGIIVRYGPKQPSKPGEQLGTETYTGIIGNPEAVGSNPESTHPVTAYGAADDYARISVGSRSKETDRGDNVSIDMDFGLFPDGVYQVSVTQENDDNEDEANNESMLFCTINGVTEGEVRPKKNPTRRKKGREPVCECDSTCTQSSPDTPSGGAPQQAARITSGGARVLYNIASESTSGGTSIARESDAWWMEWSVQFGVFRGMPQMPAGRLCIAVDGGYEESLGRVSGLVWKHPLSSWMAMPEGGARRNAMLAVHQGSEIHNSIVDGTGEQILSVGATASSCAYAVCQFDE